MSDERELAEGFAADHPADARVLDAGWGAGVPVGAAIADAGHRVVGLDASREQLRLTRERNLELLEEAGFVVDGEDVVGDDIGGGGFLFVRGRLGGQ